MPTPPPPNDAAVDHEHPVEVKVRTFDSILVPMDGSTRIAELQSDPVTQGRSDDQPMFNAPTNTR
ncbi:hypothetical protein [Stieleria neptunia]|uniref:hypothetical protein n=1 Tax=Stieleria neptunia TaxID=2527979 RepID=UPI0011A2CF0C|nr:hypothetical protein [Stieleria neptunia]